MAQSNNILQELTQLGSPLAGFSRDEVYSVPKGYFEELPALVMMRIRTEGLNAKEELEAISPLLSGLKKEIPLEVPQGYFDSIGKPKARVVSFTKAKWFRVAAAAVTTGVVFLVIFLNFGPESNERKAQKVMARLSRDINKMSEPQKDNMIDYIEPGINGNEIALLISRNNEVKQLLQDIPEEELKLFQEQSEDIEEVLMIN
jgi:hypothetical protein